MAGWRKVSRRAAGLALGLAFLQAAFAQSTAQPSTITAVGSASVSVSPDLAHVDVGVTTQAATAQAAAAANASQSGAMISALQALLGANANIKTVNYSLSPVYNNPPPGQNATIVGYTVTNTVEITLTDLTQIGQVIDTSIQNGANRVQGVSFDLQDRNPPTAQALKNAAASARGQADAIAAGLNLHTGAVLHAVEGTNFTTPLVGVTAGASSTPIQTGLVVVQATVTLEVAIAP